MIDLISLTLAQARDALRKKDFSATELVEAYLAALEKARALNAFVLEAPGGGFQPTPLTLRVLNPKRCAGAFRFK